MCSSPCVSVIVPNYNHANYLCERIESILQQTFDDFELILLDDCSTDNSKQILFSYQKSPKVSHLVFNQQNSGSTFKQWDKGFSLARGKYIWIAESDDFADPTFLEQAVHEFERSEKVVVVFTGSHIVDERSRIIKDDWDSFPKSSPERTVNTGINFVRANMIRSNRIYNASMVLFKKEYCAGISDMYKQFRYCGDWLFWAEMCRLGDVVCINRKLNYFRQHLCKVSVNAPKEGLDLIEGCVVIQHLIDELQLPTYQRIVISGRVQKRLYGKKSVDKIFRQQILTAHKPLFTCGRWAILVYELDKLVRFLERFRKRCFINLKLYLI